MSYCNMPCSYTATQINNRTFQEFKNYPWLYYTDWRIWEFACSKTHLQVSGRTTFWSIPCLCSCHFETLLLHCDRTYILGNILEYMGYYKSLTTNQSLWRLEMEGQNHRHFQHTACPPPNCCHFTLRAGFGHHIFFSWSELPETSGF